eukprot:6021795-Prymnesium_polylepis.1
MLAPSIDAKMNDRRGQIFHVGAILSTWRPLAYGAWARGCLERYKWAHMKRMGWRDSCTALVGAILTTYEHTGLN